MREETKIRLLKMADDGVRSTSPVNVLMLSAAGEMGGAERSLYEVLRHLPSEKVNVRTCVPPDSPLGRVCSMARVPVHEIPMRRFRRTTNPFVLAGQLRAIHQGSKQIATLCQQHDVKLIHANTDTAAVMAWEVSRQSHLPFIWHCRDMRPMHGFARNLAGGAAAVVAISGAVRRHLINEGVGEGKIHLIYNGIDIPRFHPAAARAQVRSLVRAQLGIPSNQPVVLCVAAYVPWKRIELFYESFALILRKVPGALGLLVGSDLGGMAEGYEKELNKPREALGLNENVLKVLHQRDDVPDLMAAADVLVSGSENEPFGRVIAEAGAAGLPVVTTDSGGKGEIVADGVSGFLVKQGDANGLANATAMLLQDSKVREEMGDAARKHIALHFDVRRTAAELANLFVSLA